MSGDPYLQDADCTLWHGDALDVLSGMEDGSVDCVVTSPPYFGLRDYGTVRQLGLEETPESYVTALYSAFREVRRVLASQGTCWLVLGDSYANDGKWGGSTGGKHAAGLHGAAGGLGRGKRITGRKPKDLIGVPWQVAFALQTDGWWLRSAITWCKPNAMPESVTDRPTKATEMIFLLTRSAHYYYDAEAIQRPHKHDGRAITTVTGRDGSIQHRNGERWPGTGANERDFWLIPTQPYPQAHFAVFPEELVRRCILAGSREGDTVLDPFVGSGTTCKVARDHGRRSVGIDLSEPYLRLACDRLAQQSLLGASER